MISIYTQWWRAYKAVVFLCPQMLINQPPTGNNAATTLTELRVVSLDSPKGDWREHEAGVTARFYGFLQGSHMPCNQTAVIFITAFSLRRVRKPATHVEGRWDIWRTIASLRTHVAGQCDNGSDLFICIHRHASLLQDYVCTIAAGAEGSPFAQRFGGVDRWTGILDCWVI